MGLPQRLAKLASLRTCMGEAIARKAPPSMDNNRGPDDKKRADL